MLTTDQRSPQAEHASLTREQVVDRIIEINPSATVAFLSRFEERPLRAYLDHLIVGKAPRGPASVWIRPGDSPAIVMHDSAD
ncbi:hypothetical protein J4558_03365 [Leptolyngbya sp. 15MV]|nr:hypothetical protein J4558_03365 [Leptolyngbya sp. 15MV]